MKIYSDNGPAMAGAIDQIYRYNAMHLEGSVFRVADHSSDDYRGGTWNFVTNDEDDLGFWYPSDTEFFAVACENYFEHSAMDARSFGAACTLVALNQLIWRLHSGGLDFTALTDQFHALRHWIFDLGEGDEPFIDTAAVAGFID